MWHNMPYLFYLLEGIGPVRHRILLKFDYLGNCWVDDRAGLELVHQEAGRPPHRRHRGSPA